MIIGQKDLTIDDKFRVVLPSLFRNEFESDVCYVSQGMDQCIDIYPKGVYEERCKMYQKLSYFDPEARKIQRIFFSNTYLVEIDSHNRILLPKNLLISSNITKTVTALGICDHLELWDKDIYDKKNASDGPTFSDSAKNLIAGM